jgi:hypothetical protein
MNLFYQMKKIIYQFYQVQYKFNILMVNKERKKNYFILLSIHHFSLDSTSSASSSSNNEPVNKTKTSKNIRTIKKHCNGKATHYKSLNTLAHHSTNGINSHPSSSSSPRITVNHRSHPPISNNSLSKTISNSIADLSLSIQNSKNRSLLFQSKLDHYNNESYKKIPLSQNYDWGMLAITNTDLILLYNKDKSSLIIFDANGNENEVKKKFFFFILIYIFASLENSMVRWGNKRFMYLS